MRRFAYILPHACVVLALYFGACIVLDWYNPLMNFAGNAVSSKLLWVFCLCSVCGGIRQLWLERLLAERPPAHAAAPRRPFAIKRSA